jgi:hypothetical protein
MVAKLMKNVTYYFKISPKSNKIILGRKGLYKSELR